ncbi:MAG: alpha/beta hydrolase [Thermodesulfobacteriota bacterium]|nr:alpha/beta hydrolase [Thermodesulfobacteriota bacterium]
MVTKHHYSHSIMFLHRRRIKKPIANAILYGSVLTLRLLEKFIKADIVIKGGEGIPENPVLFVVNHFTRVETILLPYIIRKATNNIPNSLADSSFFKGKLGDYMKTVGTLSVDTPHRNDIIIGDLITGRKNWVIFPEGAMIKTKRVIRSKGFSVHYPGREGPIHTGSAYLAVLSELYKRDVQHALRKGDEERIRGYCKRFAMESPDEISLSETIIIPTNLTYFPIRPGRNRIQSLAAKFVKEIPERLEEELEIEGNLLFSDASIHVTFGSPIMVGDFLTHYYFSRIRCISSVKEYQRRLIHGNDPTDYNLSRISRRLTNHFMDKIYSMVTVNIDHLFSFGLLSLNRKKINDYSFKCRLFLACEEMKRKGKFNLHPVLENLPLELIADEGEKMYDSIEEFSVKEKFIEKRDHTYFIDEKKLKKIHDFHRIRVENTIRVIANEIDHVDDLCSIIRGEFHRSEKRMKSEMIHSLRKLDLDIFREDYDTYYNKEFTKPEKIGEPFYLNPKRSQVGILICHGYMSAPEEVRILGDYLSQLGYSVYGPRLKGHGTSPYNLENVTWHDWYDSFNRGYAILRNACEQVIIGGFSTGGTLALLAAANKKSGIIGLFTINAPLQLKSIRTKLVGPIHFWNQLLERFNIEDGGLKYVDHEPENPEINYTKNSINGVRELGLLMDRCRDRLDEISVPALVIQENNDPVVDPLSASLILDKIGSKIKEFYTFELNRHGILRQEGCEEVFVKIREFIERITS